MAREIKSFTPAYIDTRLWFRGDDFEFSGSLVTQWNDKSGNGDHAIPQAGEEPTHGLTLNNQPVISFAGSQSLKLPASLIEFGERGDWECFVVFKPTASPSVRRGLLSSSKGNFGYGRISLCEDVVILYDDTGYKSTPIIIDSGTPYIIDGLWSRTDQVVSGALNGGTPTTTAWTNGEVTSGVGYEDFIFIGKTNRSGSSNYYIVGDMAELILLDRQATVSERNALLAYFKKRYGIL